MTEDRKLPANDEEEVLASPTELAGTADAAIAAEFAARDAIDAQDRTDALEPLKKDELPLDGE